MRKGEDAGPALGIGMVGLDFDLTLVDYPDGRPFVPMATRALFEELLAREIEVGIVSGRAVSDMQDILERADIRWGDPFPSFIVARETFVYRVEAGRLVADEEWNRARAAEMDQLCRAIMARAPAWLDGLAAAGLDLERWIFYSDYSLEIYLPTAEEAEHARLLLAAWVRDVPLARVHRNRRMAHVLLATAGKGESLRRAAMAKGLSPRQVVAIGDSMNDLDMLDGQIGFLAGAVGNAEEAIKKAVLRAGGVVAIEPAGLGVEQILRAYLTDNRQLTRN